MKPEKHFFLSDEIALYADFKSSLEKLFNEHKIKMHIFRPIFGYSFLLEKIDDDPVLSGKITSRKYIGRSQLGFEICLGARGGFKSFPTIVKYGRGFFELANGLKELIKDYYPKQVLVDSQ